MATQTYILDKGNRLVHEGKALEGRDGARTKLATANEYFTHFNAGSTIPPGLTLTEEGTTTAAATYGTGLGGTAVITTDDVAAKTDSLLTGLLWQADRQPVGVPLVGEIKLKSSSITTVEWWAGFWDATPDTDPIALSTTSTFTTSVPTDAAVMGYSATPTSGAAFTTGGNTILGISIDGDANTINVKSSTVAAADTYYTFRVEIDKEGKVKYFLNRKYIGAGTTSPDVPLSFGCYAAPRTTAALGLTVDYLYVGGV